MQDENEDKSRMVIDWCAEGKAHGAEGFYVWSEEYPEDGSQGPYNTYGQAVDELGHFLKGRRVFVRGNEVVGDLEAFKAFRAWLEESEIIHTKSPAEGVGDLCTVSQKGAS